MDIYCPAANLVMECDGGQHYTYEGLEADRVWGEALAKLGLRVLRFDNGQVMRHLNNVIDEIVSHCE